MTTSPYFLACHFNFGSFGSLSVLELNKQQIQVHKVTDSEVSQKSIDKLPIYLHHQQGQTHYLDPVEQKIFTNSTLTKDALAGYAYFDHQTSNVWIMNDGDKENGVDALHCNNNGSSVSIISRQKTIPEFVKTICVGKGHHVTAFSYPLDNFSKIPKQAFVSNLKDGSLSIIDNNPSTKSYLQVVDTINLADAKCEKDGTHKIPNNAFPHGIVYSSYTGKIYCLNNGYGTVSVIDPLTNTILDKITMKVSSNLLLCPKGRYLIGKGADRKTDADHVIGRLTVVDLKNMETIKTFDLTDIYPSTYKFNTEGNRLYVTTARTGNEKQLKNLKTNQLHIFKANFPDIELETTIIVEDENSKRQPIAFCKQNGQTRYVFLPNLTKGTITVLDGQSNSIVQNLSVALPNANEVTFSYWPSCFFGT